MQLRTDSTNAAIGSMRAGLRFGHLVWVLLGYGIVSPILGQRIVTTVAGGNWSFRADGSAAIDAPLGFIAGIAADNSGNVFLADGDNHRVLEVTPDGLINTVAGNGIAGYSGDGGSGIHASLNSPYHLALDAAGALYISDFGGADGCRIRKLAKGIISTVAGTGVCDQSTGNGGLATQAILVAEGIAFGPDGNLYIADGGSGTIRRIDAGGYIDRAYPAYPPKDDYWAPQSLAFDSQGNLYVGENFRIYRLSTDGSITAFAGTGTQGYTGDGGPALQAAIDVTKGLTVDSSGNVFFTDQLNGLIRKVDTSGMISTFVGMGGTVPFEDLESPEDVAAFGGRLYIADTFNRKARVVQGTSIQTLAGSGLFNSSGDGGAAGSSALDGPVSVALDGGNLYVGEYWSSKIRKISASGSITSVAGNGQYSLSPDGSVAANSSIAFPLDSLSPTGTDLFFIQSDFVSRIDAQGYLWGVVGWPTLNSPSSVAFDQSGTLLISDGWLNRIYRFTGGVLNTIAGGGPTGLFNIPSGDGGPATRAVVSGPGSMVSAPDGTLFFTDAGGLGVRSIDPSGIIQTVAGGRQGFSPDGTIARGAPMLLSGLATDSAGNLLMADNNRVRTIISGLFATIGGNGTATFSGDGGPATAAGMSVAGMAVDASGNIYVADYFNNRVREILKDAPALTDIPTDIEFNGSQGGLPVSGELLVGTTRGSVTQFAVPGMNYSVSLVDPSSTPWLTPSPLGGRSPGLVTLTADPFSLSPGDYDGQVRVDVPLAQPAARTVRVHFHVGAPQPPLLGIDAQYRQLSFPYSKGSAARVQEIVVTNRGGGTLQFSTAISLDSGKNSSWLSVSPAASQATPSSPAILSITGDPSGLPVGTYTGHLTVANLGNAQDFLSIPVTMTVSSNPKAYLLSQTGISFTAVKQGGVVPPQTFGIINIGQATLNWTVSTSVLGNVPNWIHATTPDGGQQGVTGTDANSPGPYVTVQVNPIGLMAGEYYGQVRVTVPDAANNPQVITVFLEVLKAGSDVPPTIQPAELVFAGSVGQVSPGSQDLEIYDSTATGKSFHATPSTDDGGDWIEISPTDLTIPSTSPARLVVQPVTGALNAGIHRGKILLEFSDGRIRNVPVTFVVTASSLGAGAQIWRAGPRDGVSGNAPCKPSILIPAILSLGNDFEVPAGWPVGLAAQVIDDCGNAVASGKVVVTFSGGFVPLGLGSLGQGRWEATWSTKQLPLSQVTLTITATSSDGQLTGMKSLQGGLGTIRQPPEVADDGVVSEISPVPHIPLAPGGRIAINGDRLADSTVAGTVPLQTSLAGTIVSIAGKQLFLETTTDGQVDAVIPYGIEINAPQQLLVQRDYTYSNPVYVNMAGAQPAIMTTPDGRPWVTDGTGFAVGPSLQPGQEVIVRCTGLGAVDQNVDLSASLPAGHTVNTVELPGLMISGQAVVVESSTLMPGQIGVYQIRAVVPAGLPSGSYSLVVSASGQASPAVILASQ
jgi:uncharacterized protein (TIGR03437 family)